jgi:serine/threonine protein kinase
MHRSRSSPGGTGASPRSRTLTHRVAAVPAPGRRSAPALDATSDTLFACGSDPGSPRVAPAASSAPAVAPGTVVGNVRVLEPLATGGMGEVYRGEHVHLGRRVAVKFLHPRLVGSPDAMARFTAEARAVSRIRHPGVVALFDFGPHEGGAYLVMELLEGETLAERLAATGRLAPARAIDIGIQLAEALAAAHAAGVVHRDLKPDNIVLVRDPMRAGGERAVLVDFGVAKLAAGLHTPACTLHGDLLGTPFYMSPEQCVSAPAADHRSDVYSLGCVLYRLLSGQVPFDGNLMDILLAHQNRAPEPLRALDAAIPDELAALVAHMMAKPPRARPSDMMRVAHALARIAAPARRWRPTRAAWLGAAVAVALAVAGLGHLAGW